MRQSLSPIGTATIAFALITVGSAAGIGLRRLLPEHHLSGDSKDVIKLGTALIATMSALVLALLFSSTRQSYEHTSLAVGRMTTDLVQLDRVFAEYGPEAAPLRAALRGEVGSLIDSIWREDAAKRPAAVEKPHQQSVLYMIRELSPKNQTQASLQARALQLSTDLAEIQLSLSSQSPNLISTPFIDVLVLWLVFIFAVFSMSSPSNPTLITVLFLCILSASGAIYLILEMGFPFDGLMQVPNDGLRSALK
jgi:hypothetical protein